MSNSDLIHQLVSKYGKENPDLSKRYNVSPDMKYIHLYDHPVCGDVYIDMIAVDPHNSTKDYSGFTAGRMSYRPFLAGDGGTQHHLRPLGDYKLDKTGTYNGEEVLISIINTMLTERQIRSSDNKTEFHRDIEFIKSLLSRYDKDLSEKRRRTLADGAKVDEKIHRRIHASIRKAVRENFGGMLEFPTPIPLVSPQRGLEENDCPFVVATAIDDTLTFWAPGYTDLITNDRYGIEFLNSINDLVGGRDVFEFVRPYKGAREFWIKESIPEENETEMTPLESLNALIQTDGGVGLNYRPFTDYSYDRICKKDGEYILEYTIHQPKPILHKKISADMALEICEKSGLDLVKKVQERIDEGKEYDAKRFRKALQTLMPNLYEEVIEQGKADVKNLAELIQWKKTTEKTSNKIKELREKTPSGNLEDVPHLTTQVLRMVGEDNLGKPKRSKTEKKIIKSAIEKAVQSFRS